MADNLTKQRRSYNMSRIRSRDTKPELIIKPFMRKLGFAYQPKMYGHPDFADKKTKTVVFIDGCFWHGCPKHFIMPKSNIDYWRKKISRNALRDKKVNMLYKNKGWKVVRIWEHEITK
jgi:DNA mismatch endonuclease (patch repair protein)